MTRETAAQYLPLVQALAEGKTIQFLQCGEWWVDMYSPEFTSDAKFYRIKPEPREFILFRPAGCSEHVATTNIQWGIKQPEAIRVREILD